MAPGQRALTQYVSVSSKSIINSCLCCPTEHYKYMPAFWNIITNICLSSKNIYQYMCLSSEIVLSMYLYHLKERDQYVCIISKYISIIRKIGCVKNSTTMGHHIHLHHCFSTGGLQTHSTWGVDFAHLNRKFFPSYLSAYEDGTDSVPKHRHIKFGSRGITQKKAYSKCLYIVCYKNK